MNTTRERLLSETRETNQIRSNGSTQREHMRLTHDDGLGKFEENNKRKQRTSNDSVFESDDSNTESDLLCTF